MKYEKCLVQLDEILKYLSDENLQKIPNDIKESIKSEKDKNYIWKYDESKALNEQNLDRKTIVILSYLNMEYLLNTKQKEFIKRIHDLNEEKLEKEKVKQEKYNTNNLFKNNKKSIVQSEVLLVQIKEDKWYNKVFYFIKWIFKRK